MEWISFHRARGNELFKAGEYSQASDAYIEALTGLDFGSSTDEKEEVQRTIQSPITCNIVACMLKLEVIET
jgi:hypothetical protein